MVIIDALKERLNRGKDSNHFYFRDSNGNEVDLIINHQRRPVPVKIKSAMTWNDGFIKGLQWFARNVPESLSGRVVFAGDFFPTGDHWQNLSFTDLGILFNSIEVETGLLHIPTRIVF
jgi:predicted AAA+ superfamily ATPase